MVEKGNKIKYVDVDVDVLIVFIVIELVKIKLIVLFGEDIDFLVLFFYYVDVILNLLIFKFGNVLKVNIYIKIWDILKIKLLFGEELCILLFLIYVISGCDIILRMFGVSKVVILKKFGEYDFFKIQVQLLCNVNVKDDVIFVGENIIFFLYNGVLYEGLNVFCYRKFVVRVLINKICV